MKFDKSMLLLYAVTDRTWIGNETLEEKIEAGIQSGITMVQLREKNITDEEYLKRAIILKKITDKFNVPLIINDNVFVALKSGAAGVHIGQADLAASKAREVLGKDKIVGVSARTVEQALAAEYSGADYLGVGAVFRTTTKLDANQVSLDTLTEISRAVSIPIVAIGGINEQNIMQLKSRGVSGAAVVSALFASEDIKKSTKILRICCEKIAMDSKF